jgi:DNA-binding transcriptional MerR regulator
VASLIKPSSKSAITYTITDLSREFDITPRTIRFYEDQGLLTPNREGNGGRNRVYTARERTKLKLALRGKRLGLSLSDIKNLIEMYSSPKDTELQLQRFIAVLTQHRAALERQREDIDVLLSEINTHEKECKRMLKKEFKTK